MNLLSILRSLPLALALAGSAAIAHHSYASFDMGKTATVSGTVAIWQWTNPHSFLAIETLGPGGAKQQWEFEAQSPAMLSRAGFTRIGIKVGDKVTVAYHPHYSKANAGSLVSVSYADGRKFGAMTRAAPGQP